MEGKRSFWSSLLDAEDVTVGLQDTRSLNSLVTDSSAASSAWGCGRRIWNGQVNMFPDGTELRPIASLLRDTGMRVGLVTTATITHATPAGFAVNCVQRDLEALIAEKYLASGVEVLMGGGDKFFSASQRKDGRDLYADFAKAGFAVAKTRDELKAAKTQGKVLGVFNGSHMPYVVDRENNPELKATRPTLAEMTAHAIANLKNSPKGFLLQVEGGRVDHAGHANDLASLIHEQLDFEEALKVVVDFARADKETLVIITADHATGGPALNGAGAEYIESTAGLKTVAGMKASYPTLLAAMGDKPSETKVAEVISDRLGIALKKEEASALSATLNGNSPFAVSAFYGSPSATLGVILGNYSKVTWTSLNHTSDHVLVSALGPGSEAVSELTPNYHFFNMMLSARGIKFSNAPQMDFEKAKGYYQKLKVSLRQDRELFTRYAAHENCPCHTDWSDTNPTHRLV